MHLFIHMCLQSFNNAMLYRRFGCRPHRAHYRMEETDMHTVNHEKRILSTLREVCAKYQEPIVREIPTDVY